MNSSSIIVTTVPRTKMLKRHTKLNEGNLQAGGVMPEHLWYTRSVPVNSLQQGIDAWVNLNLLNMSGQEASFVVCKEVLTGQTRLISS